MKTIFRYQVHVDDQWHRHTLSGRIIHVAARALHTVEFWAVVTDEGGLPYEFRVVGTGHPIDDDEARVVGTAIAPGDQLVWHLLARDAATALAPPGITMPGTGLPQLGQA